MIKAIFGKVKADVKRFYGVSEADPVGFAQQIYVTLINIAANHEENMRKAGIPIPKLVEYSIKDHIGRQGGEVERAYVPCNRCEFQGKCGEDWECTIKREVVDGSYTRYLVTNYDGCSKGILRREYR